MGIKKRYIIALIPVVIVLVGGWNYRWVAEDAYIDFRVVHNILHGYGPVFNPGERVEVYTDPLWVALLTVFSGVFSFISVQWWSVILGLVTSGGGFWLAGLATSSLASKNDDGEALPVGLVCLSVVGGVWMFVTSGLETGLIFGWLGLSWWLLVRALREANRGIYLAALVISLGFAIRPDMALFTLTDGSFLVLLMWRKDRAQESRTTRRVVGLLVALVAIPIASELFRIAYFGLLVSNTSIAKSAASSYWSQGEKYLWNFLRPYFFFIPLMALGAVTVARMRQWWRGGNRLDVLLVSAPVLGGVLDILYVVRVGGDFMHARMLLPGFFAIFSVFWMYWPPSRLNIYPTLSVGAVVWSLVCLLVLRYTVAGIGSDLIANERMFYITMSANPHPISVQDYSTTPWEITGFQLRREAATLSPRHKVMSLNAVGASGPFLPVSSPLPEVLYDSFSNIGLKGLAAGSSVYVFDLFSLANPIGSHITLTARGRPGQEKFVSQTWMIARFANTSITQVPSYVSRSDLSDARAALACQPLAGYLHTITNHFSLGDIFTNFAHAFTWTTMTFSNDPHQAREQLCGST